VRKSSSRGRVALALIATTFAVGTSAAAAGGSRAGSTAPDGTEAIEPGSSGAFIMAMPSVPETLDPQTYQAGSSNDTYPVWSANLIRYAELPPEITRLQGPDDIVGSLAESWEVAEDGTITMTLKDAVSPYGNTVTSEDVRWSFERMKEFDPIVGFLFDVGSFDTEELITPIDDKTFTVNVTGPNILTMRTFTWYGTGILDSTEALAHATEDDPWATEWLSTNTATYGPFHVTDFTPGQEVRLEANPEYFGGAPAFSEVIIRAVPDSSTRLQLLTAGEVDYAGNLALDHFNALDGNPDVMAAAAPTSNIDVMYLNFAYEPFANPDVRRAIAMAVDRDALVAGAYQGRGTAATHHLDQDLFFQDYPVDPIAYDVEAAKALLAEAGYPDGFSFTLSAFNGRPGPQAESLAILLRDQLAAIGIDVEIETVASSADFGEGRARTDGQPPRFQAWLDISSPVIPDTAYYAAPAYGSGGSSNLMGYVNEEMDALIEQALTLPQGDERDAVLARIAVIADEDTPTIPLVETIYPIAFGADIEGWYPIADNRTLPDLYWRAEG
jgi:peptide/nickel transport system substrate-binding protein